MPITGLPKRTHVFSLHWKHRKRFPDETFITTRSISEKYPAYCESILDKLLKNSCSKVEDENVLIKKALLTYQSSKSGTVPKISTWIFWEFEQSAINWRKGYRQIIQRVLEWGTREEWDELVRYYGMPVVSNTIRNQALYLPDHTIDQVCDYFSFKREELLCYIRKQSMPKHWI
jgi:hypothetical protein